MQLRRLLLATLTILVAAAPAWAQDEGRRSVTPSRMIRIPTDQELQREVFTEPSSNFSAIDATADGELERMDREIDRAVMRGICTGC